MRTVEEIRNTLEGPLAGDAGVRFALLFGSVVTDDPTRARDVDVAVSFAEPRSLLELGRLEGVLEQALGREVDVVDLDQASTLLRWEVARDAQVIHCRERDALVDFRARAALDYFDLEPYRTRQADGLRRALRVNR